MYFNCHSRVSNDTESLARRLLMAIMKLNYREIEQLIAINRDKKGFLLVKDKNGNTFIHLIGNLITDFLTRGIKDCLPVRDCKQIPIVDSASAPFIHKVSCMYIKLNLSFYSWITMKNCLVFVLPFCELDCWRFEEEPPTN